jgi:mannose-1-phosphate guanylyltransferase / mannose-6-phosphate isomerase
MELVSVILSGGAGSRLWPVSRELHPKPFIKMEGGNSLLQKAFSRVASIHSVSEIMTVTNRDLCFQTEDEYSAINTNNLLTSFILEPVGRNTAPAIATAALQAINKYGCDVVLLILSADHLIEKQAAFENAVATASKLAQKGYLVTFGIQPEHPETGFGYIEASGENLLHDADNNCHIAKRFIEKPSLEKAKKYLAVGNYFWNSGMFCFTAGTVIDELAQYAPEVLTLAKESLVEASLKTEGNTQKIELNADAFSKAPSVSIDYAVMEKSNKVAVVSCDIGWSDVGSWKAISELKQPDEQGNGVVGEVLLHDVNNCYIQSSSRLIGAIGVENLIIVDTPDALLITDKSRTQDVKKIVTQLKDNDDKHHKIHLEVYRPWGTYTVLEEGERFKIKKIIVRPGASLSLQLHHHRNEHWIVVDGVAQVTNDGKSIMLNKNESTYILAGHKHRLENPGVVDLVIIEVQSGEYLGEDDIVRFDDIYGRN